MKTMFNHHDITRDACISMSAVSADLTDMMENWKNE